MMVLVLTQAKLKLATMGYKILKNVFQEWVEHVNLLVFLAKARVSKLKYQ